MKEQFHLNGKIEDSKRILDAAIMKFKPNVVLAGFTGGSDSLVLVHLLEELGIKFRPIFCNTGIGIIEQWVWIREYCKKRGWDLIEQQPVYRTYKQMILANGFPGAAMHRIMYQNLKEKSLIHVNNQFNKQAIICTGVRISESERRKINITDEIQYVPKTGLKWVSPIINWDSDDKDEFLDSRNIEKSPVSSKIGMSGECLCGAYAKKGELQKIAENFPETAAVINDLENLLAYIGFTWGWEDQPPKEKELTRLMESIFPGFKEIKLTKRQLKEQKDNKQDLFMPMCHKCEYSITEAEAEAEYNTQNSNNGRHE